MDPAYLADGLNRVADVGHSTVGGRALNPVVRARALLELPPNATSA